MTTRPLLSTLALVLALALTPGCGDDGGGDGGSGDTGADTGGDTGGGGSGEPITCDLATQDPCTADQHCSYDGEGATVCFVRGEVAYGEPCSELEPCEEGVCLSVNGTTSLCYRFCADELACPGDADCLELGGVPFQVCEIQGIYEACDLLEQNCAADGAACYSVASEATPVCVPAGAAEAGQGCTDANDCLGGLVCVASVCQQLCDTSAASAECGADAICAAYYEADGAGYCAD